MVNFTDRFIKNLKPTGKKYYLQEQRGFAISVSPAGCRTFVFVFKENGKNKYLNLGTYPEVTLAEARVKYTTAYNIYKQGKNPKEKLLPAPVPEKRMEDMTVSELFDLYRGWSEANHSTQHNYECSRTLQVDVLSTIGGRAISSIKRRDAIELIEKVAIRAAGQARNVQKAARAMFQYALDREYIESNPFLRISKAVPSITPKSRERTLTDQEIQLVWQRVDECSVTPDVKRALKVILVTAQRPGEVAGMHMDEIQFGEGKPICKTCRGCGWWTIPWNRIKTEVKKGMSRQPRNHRVYLTPMAMELIGNEEGAVFKSYQTGKAIARNSISQMISRLLYVGLDRWTPHDLRRTGRTLMARSGVLREHAEEVINHTREGVVGVYDLHDYDNEKRVALLKLEGELKRIIAPTIS